MEFRRKQNFIQLGCIFLLCLTVTSHASDQEFGWQKLVPENAYDFIPETGITEEMWEDPEFNRQVEEAGRKIKPELKGQEISLPGFMVPIKYNGSEVTQFLLVPEAGQCIHVPPPPPNQALLVTVDEAVEMRSPYVPIMVQGILSPDMQVTALGEIGYDIEAKAESGYRLQALSVKDYEY